MTPTPEEARAAAEAGMARVEAKAGSMGFDRVGVRRKIVELLREAPGNEMFCEAISNACMRHGFVPHSKKAFGAPIKWLQVRAFIFEVGQRARDNGHRAPGGRIWRLGPSPFDLEEELAIYAEGLAKRSRKKKEPTPTS